MSTLYYESSFAHHGIKGQKWGVRRYQNPDGTLTPRGQKRYGSESKSRDVFLDKHIIPEGTVLYRTVADANETSEGAKYVTYLDIDRDLYRGQYSSSISNHAGNGYDGIVYEKTFKTKEAIVIPSRDELQKAYEEVLSDPKIFKETLSNFGKTMFDLDTYDFEMNFDWENPDGTTKSDAQYDQEFAKARIDSGKNFVDSFLKENGSTSIEKAFVPATVALGTSPKLKAELIKNLSSKGYNAMVDEAGVGGKNGWGREGVDPIVIFDSKKSMIETSTSAIDKQTSDNATKRYQKWQRKATQNSSKGKW